MLWSGLLVVAWFGMSARVFATAISQRCMIIYIMAGTGYDLEDRLIAFAVQICLLTEQVPRNSDREACPRADRPQRDVTICELQRSTGG